MVLKSPDCWVQPIAVSYRRAKRQLADVDLKPRPRRTIPKKKVTSSAALIAILGMMLISGVAAPIALSSLKDQF